MQQNLPHILNLGNSIIGVTVLAMPFCFQECGIILGIILLLFCTWLTLVSCQLLMKAGITSRKRSYGFLAQYTHGAPGKLAVEVGMIGLQLGTLIAQVVIIGDLGPAIVSKWTGYENSNNLRTALIIILCLCVGLPLGLLRDLHTVSTASTGCICFYSFFVFYVMTLSSQNLRAGNWVEKVNMWRTDGLFKCLPIFSFAFGCQTQLFILFDVLPEPSLKGINSIVRSAVNMCTVAYLLVGFFGYIAFCDVEIGGDIITQFSETHMSDILKIGFVLSIAVTFPLIIFPCRSSLYTLLFSPKPKQEDIEARPVIPEVHFKAITITIVLVSMITGILVPNVEFVLAMNGATMGTLICYIFPAMFFLRVMTGSSEGKNRAQLVFVFGVTIMLLCTYTTLNSQEHVQPKTRETLGIKSGKGTLPVDKSALLKQPIEVQGNVPILEKDKDKIPPDKSKEKRDEGIIDDKRIEPPNPKPPDDEQKNGSNLEKNDEKAVDKKSELENTKDVEKSKSGKKRKHNTSKDSKVKDLEKSQNEEIKEQEDLSVMEKEEEKVPEKDIIEKKEEIKEEKDVNGKKDEEKEEKYVDEKKEDKVQDEKESALDAKKQKELIAKLEKQQIEQKKLIEEQKEILKELKEHKIQEHDNVDKIQGNVEQEKRDDTHQNVEGQQVNVGGQQVNAGGQQVNMGGQVNMGDQQANVGGQVNIGGQQANVGGQQLYAGGQQQKLIQQQQQPLGVQQQQQQQLGGVAQQQQPLGVQQQQQPLGGVAQQQQPLGGVQQQQQQQPLGGVAQQQQPLGGVQQQQQPLGGVAQQQQPLGGVQQQQQPLGGVAQQQQPLGGVQQQQQPLGGVQQQQQPLGGVQQQQQQLGGVQQQQAFGGQQQLGGGQQQLEGGQQKHIPVKRDVSGQQEQQVLGDQQQLGGRQQLPQQLGDEFQEFKAAIISGRQQQQDGGIHNIQSKDGTGEKDGTVDSIKSPNSQQKLQGQQNNDNAPKQQPPVEKKEQQQQEPPVAQNMEQNPKEKKTKAKPEKTVSKDRNDKKKEDKDKEKSVNDEMRRKKLSIDEINDDTLYVQKAADQLLVGGTPGQLASGVLRSLKSVHEDK